MSDVESDVESCEWGAGVGSGDKTESLRTGTGRVWGGNPQTPPSFPLTKSPLDFYRKIDYTCHVTHKRRNHHEQPIQRR